MKSILKIMILIKRLLLYFTILNINSILAQFSTITITSDLCNLSKYSYCKTQDTLKYRTISGDCNNLVRPWIGKACSPMKRFNSVSSSYNDNIGSPRRFSVNGRLLTPSRRVANAVLYPLDQFSNVTLFHALFGKMVSNDISNAPQPQDSSGRNIRCNCTDTNNPLCLVLPTTPDDKENLDQKCMATPRTLSSLLNWNCRSSFREQINKISTWLDQSHLYGSTLDDSLSLRRNNDSGFLLSQQLPGFIREVFTAGKSGPNQCLRDTVSMPCFQSGDSRLNLNTGLTAVQVLFLRLHNFVAKKLQDLNGWSNQILYQETRKITNAIYQHIIYNEWLEIVVGTNMMRQFSLKPLNSSYFYGYNSFLNVHVQNEFSTAAFRYGHYMIPSFFYKSDVNLNNFKTLNLSELSYTPWEAYRDGGLDALCRGQIKNPALKLSSHYSDAVHNHLFDVGIMLGNSKRYSLSAFDIERGRDHGLKPYNSYRSAVGLVEAKNFSGLLSNMQLIRINELRSVYTDVNDIDLIAGGLCEDNLPNALVGQTFAYIIASQFDELKRGDRFYYENDLTPTGFSEPQLNEIRKYTIARLICDNLDIQMIQRNPFYVVNNVTNPLVRCSDIPNINFSVFMAH